MDAAQLLLEKLYGFKLYLVYRCIMKGCKLSSNMGAVRLLLEEDAF
jgi:hypothetical protein